MIWTRFRHPFIAVFSMLMLVAGIMLIPRQAQTPVLAQSPVSDTQSRTITVNGSGSSLVQPDIAYITLGVQTENETASAALTQNNQQMQEVTQALRTAGVASADIQTSIIQVYPRYEDTVIPQEGAATNQQENTTQQVSGYVAVNTVQVTVRNISQLGEVIDQVVEAGGNRVENIRFDVENQTQAVSQARQAAFEDAQQKAAQLAELADVELGSVITITENSYFPRMFQETAADMAASGGPVPVSPGSQSINVDLSITWEIQ